MNRYGEKPDNLTETEQKNNLDKTVDLVEQESLTRFDKRKSNNRKKRYKNGNWSRQGENNLPQSNNQTAQNQLSNADSEQKDNPNKIRHSNKQGFGNPNRPSKDNNRRDNGNKGPKNENRRNIPQHKQINNDQPIK